MFAFYTLLRQWPIRQLQISHISNEISGLNRMSGWQVHSYGDDIQFSDKIKIPAIQNPNDVLIRITAASINPIDIEMCKGYGSTVFNIMRWKSNSVEFPLILGREFSGIVQQVGMGVKDINADDEVWGVVEPYQVGSHAQYVVVNANNISIKPPSLSHTEASAVLYGALTAWSGLFLSGNLDGRCGPLSCKSSKEGGKKVCVLGASGSVGNLAVQIAKFENAKVIATCASDCVEIVEKVGANIVIDYTSENASQELISNGPYDIILDCAGLGPDYAAKLPWKYSSYITFTSPLLRNVDTRGIGAGMFKNVTDLLGTNWNSFRSKNGLVKWAFFTPSPRGIKYLAKLVNEGKLKPMIESVIDFKSANDAYRRVAEGHLRGKIVLKME